jgi:hypothetical protein
LPWEIHDDLVAYVGCIAGAVLIADYQSMLHEAGFSTVEITDTTNDLNAYTHAGDSGCCGATSCCAVEEPGDETLPNMPTSYDVNSYAASVHVHAVKPQEPATAGRGRS